MQSELTNVAIVSLQKPKPLYGHTGCACHKLQQFGFLFVFEPTYGVPKPCDHFVVGLTIEIPRIFSLVVCAEELCGSDVSEIGVGKDRLVLTKMTEIMQ